LDKGFNLPNKLSKPTTRAPNNNPPPPPLTNKTALPESPEDISWSELKIRPDALNHAIYSAIYKLISKDNISLEKLIYSQVHNEIDRNCLNYPTIGDIRDNNIKWQKQSGKENTLTIKSFNKKITTQITALKKHF
jgi:hypothetical protein